MHRWARAPPTEVADAAWAVRRVPPAGSSGATSLDRQLATCHNASVLDVDVVKALANDKRLMILDWLRDPEAHFPPQRDGDLVADGVCSLLIAEKLRVSQPTCGEHLKVLSRAGLIRGKRIKQWVFYQRDETRIAAAKDVLGSDW
jgi:DNA-binding transcriptional ArsR family regulator